MLRLKKKALEEAVSHSRKPIMSSVAAGARYICTCRKQHISQALSGGANGGKVDLDDGMDFGLKLIRLSEQGKT